MTDQTITKRESPARLLVEANRLRYEGSYNEALTLYRRFAERFGQSPNLIEVIAGCYYAVTVGHADETGENYLQAVEWMQKAIALEPNNARFHAKLAYYLWLGLNDYKSAAREYYKALELEPDNVGALVGIAALYGVPEEVVTLNAGIRSLERAVALEPDEPNQHATLARLYHEAGRIADARQACLNGLLCPQSLDPRIAAGLEAILDGAELR